MRLAKEVKNDVENDLKAVKKIPRLPWWGVLCGIIGSALTAWLFDHFGRLNLGLPTLVSIAILAFAIRVKWGLRRRVWFWVTMTVIAALHVLLILSVRWTTKWVPAVVSAGIGIADFYVMFAILSVVGKFVDKPKTSET